MMFKRLDAICMIFDACLRDLYDFQRNYFVVLFVYSLFSIDVLNVFQLKHKIIIIIGFSFLGGKMDEPSYILAVPDQIQLFVLSVSIRISIVLVLALVLVLY